MGDASVSSSSSLYLRLFGKEWKTTPTTMPDASRSYCAYASFLEEDRHFLLGGRDAWNVRSSAVVEYDAASQTFATSHTPLPEPRNSGRAVAINDHCIALVGGMESIILKTTAETETAEAAAAETDDAETETAETVKSCLLYDTRTKQWSALPELQTKRQEHSCVVFQDCIYAIGGRKKGTYDAVCRVEKLNLSKNEPSWERANRLGEERVGCCAVVDPQNNDILVVGGWNKPALKLASCEAIVNRWRKIPPLATERCFHAAVVVEKRFLVVMGGRNNTGCLASVEVLDLAAAEEAQAWRPLPPMQRARSQFTLAAGGANAKSP